MRGALILGAVWLLFCGLRVSPCVAQVSPEGVWVGELRLENQRTFIRVNYRIEGGGFNATIEMPSSSSGLTRVDLKRVSFQSHRIHFELDRGSGTLVFDGQLRNNEILGEVRQGDTRGTFQLIRSTTIEPQLLTNLYGIYQVNLDRFIWIGKFGEFGADQFFLDSASGRFGPLYPSSETALFSGQAIMSPFFPIDVRITFTKNRNGEVTGLIYNQSGLPSVSAGRVRLRREEVNFRNGNVTLAGTLTTPLRRGQHPAMVLIHGSGPEDRDYLGPWIDFFAARGVAVLSYDKRGVRASTGDWRAASLEDLAGDVSAGVQLLKSRSDINPRQIGLWAISQGGWVAPIVASSPRNDIAFIILHAGASVTPAQQGLLSIESELRAYGFPDEEIREAMAYYRLNDDFTRTGEGWERLQDAYQRASARNAEWLLEEPQPRDHWFRQMYRRLMDFDPVPYWERVTCPVLAFFGELDRTVPPEGSERILEDALRRAGNRNHRIIVLPKANHLFLRAETGVRTEYPQLKSFVTGYFDVMTNWLSRRVSTRR